MKLLDPIRLAFECPLRWEKLLGDDRQRYCEACQEHVHNLSAMTRAEAEALVARSSEPICIRIARDPQGRAVFLQAAPGLAVTAGLVAAAFAAPQGLDLEAAAPHEGASAVHHPSGTRTAAIEPGRREQLEFVQGRMPDRDIEPDLEELFDRELEPRRPIRPR